MNIDPVLLAIIGEIIIVTFVMGMGIYVGTHLKKTSK
ncbi:MAG: hypothetical protein CEO21_1 [Microgenomates group bacterium Gr01-1014_80]|nr:MAG: hypothetical protein CEO21_1 [Microgenomates group bacterium Gr01-1014_80]